MAKTPAIIVDLDGTLCDASHRTHHLEKEPKNWEAFYAACAEDLPNKWCLELVRRFSEDHAILFLTGRPEAYRSSTVKWLDTFYLLEHSFTRLWMREDGNFEADTLFKTRVYHEHIELKFNVLFAIDDRKQVAKMWRELGVTCLHCAEGDF